MVCPRSDWGSDILPVTAKRPWSPGAHLRLRCGQVSERADAPETKMTPGSPLLSPFERGHSLRFRGHPIGHFAPSGSPNCPKKSTNKLSWQTSQAGSTASSRSATTYRSPARKLRKSAAGERTRKISLSTTATETNHSRAKSKCPTGPTGRTPHDDSVVQDAFQKTVKYSQTCDLRKLSLIVCRRIVFMSIIDPLPMKRHTKPHVKRRFGLAVKKRRLELNISQEELAARAGLHRTYISDIERGARNLSLENIEKVANGLELEMSTLFSKYGIEE